MLPTIAIHRSFSFTSGTFLGYRQTFRWTDNGFSTKWQFFNGVLFFKFWIGFITITITTGFSTHWLCFGQTDRNSSWFTATQTFALMMVISVTTGTLTNDHGIRNLAVGVKEKRHQQKQKCFEAHFWGLSRLSQSVMATLPDSHSKKKQKFNGRTEDKSR